jgi:hypothetical protein
LGEGVSTIGDSVSLTFGTFPELLVGTSPLDEVSVGLCSHSSSSLKNTEGLDFFRVVLLLGEGEGDGVLLDLALDFLSDGLELNSVGSGIGLDCVGLALVSG